MTAADAALVIFLQVDPIQLPQVRLGNAACIFSSIWLSSDLDIESSAYKRWGLLRGL